MVNKAVFKVMPLQEEPSERNVVNSIRVFYSEWSKYIAIAFESFLSHDGKEYKGTAAVVAVPSLCKTVVVSFKWQQLLQKLDTFSDKEEEEEEQNREPPFAIINPLDSYSTW